MYNVARLKEDEQCTGCRICILLCPEANAIRLVQLENKRRVVDIVDPRCKGCALCVEMCPKDALELVSVTY